MTLISPSALALAGLGLPPEGTLNCTSEGEACAVCGTALHVGDRIDVLALPPSFTNAASLANPSGRFRCGACTSVMTRKEFQMGLSTAIFCRDGYFPIIRKENRAWAFLTPPEPPFAICIQNAKQQHVVWRAPVSLSRDLIMVRVGEQILRLRRNVLLEARDEALRLQDPLKKMQASTKKERGRPSETNIETPFFSSWKLQSCGAGTIKPWVTALLKSGLIQPSNLTALSSLNSGEVWAMNAVLHQSPTKPASLTL